MTFQIRQKNGMEGVSFIQILVYYFLEVSLIAFISTSFENFLVKFVIVLAFSKKKKEKKKKAYYKIKGINFCYKKIMILNIC